MSLDLSIIYKRSEEEILAEIREGRNSGQIVESVEVDQSIFDENITHNLGTMAKEVKTGKEGTSLYDLLWHPYESGFPIVTDEYIELVDNGLDYLKKNRKMLEKYNPPNGWGSYSGLLDFTKNLVFSLKNINPNKHEYIINAWI